MEEHEGQVEELLAGSGKERQSIVGLGGSAGSLKALRSFFSNMVTDSGLAFVVIVHLSPDHESSLPSLLQDCTSMPVVQVRDTVQVQPNTVYVIPPAKHLTLADGHLLLSKQLPERGRRVAVDLFFRTMADTHGASATAIVLSGADGDGSIGLKRVKERGGLTIAQDPEESEHVGMPDSAIATGMVDWILPVAEMPARLLQYYRSQPNLFLPAEKPPEQQQAQASDVETSLRDILTLLRVSTGHDFSDYKRATILRRIGRRMQINGVQELTTYLSFVRTHPGEVGALLQDLLISVTNFFRDHESFHALEPELFRVFRGKKSGDQVRVWIVGCATGEEAYSIAMLLAECAGRLKNPPSVQLFATDIDDMAIQTARQGLYPETIEADVSEQRLHRFFSKSQGRYLVNQSLRDSILFASHNALKDSPFSHLDLISCRNLLIYLNRQAQAHVFDLFHFALNPEGLLFLGSSESIDDERPLFTFRDKKHRLYSRLAHHRRTIPILTGTASLARTLELDPRLYAPKSQRYASASPIGGKQSLSLVDLHFRLLEGFTPASVLIDKDDNIVHLSERAERYLHLGSGEATLNLLRVVQPTLRVELRSAIFQARQVQTTITVSGIPLQIQDTNLRVDLHVKSAKELDVDFVLVLFEEHQDTTNAKVAEVKEAEPIVRQLEAEIDQVKSHQRATAEEYEASLEELKASNEELQAMNEEMRSATEELETSREELQSINEELSTVNQELKSKLEELSKANGDLQNLMASTDIATIFLDRHLCIQRYTPAATKLFNLIPSDLGRPLSDLSHRLEDHFIIADAERVLEKLIPVEREQRSQDGQWFIARLVPYRTAEDTISGVVLTFIEITERKAAENEKARLDTEVLRAQEHLRMIFENVREYAIFSIDRERRVTSWNVGAERLLGYDEDEIVGRTFDSIFTSEDQAVSAPEKEVAQAFAEGHAIDERWHQRKDGSRFWGSGVIMAMRAGSGDVVGLVNILRDQTDSRQANEELLKALRDTEAARFEAETANASKDRFLAVLSHELRTPLTPVQLALGILGSEKGLSDSAGKAIEMIRRNVEMEILLIDDLLDVSRIVHGKFEIESVPVDVHTCVHRSIELTKANFVDNNLKLTLLLEATRSHLLGDERRLKQVFCNLLQNATKFTPNGGAIIVRSRDLETKGMAIDFIDNGIGIEPEALPKLFNPFEQGSPDVARRYGGLGLGLAISRNLAQVHGGRVTATSEGLNRGASFTVELPTAFATLKNDERVKR